MNAYKKLNRHCGSGPEQGVVHDQARMEIVHNHGNSYHEWLFYQNVLP